MAGNIRIIEPTENYQKVSKGIIFNRDIDALTLGIYVKVLCLGKEWELNIQGLAITLNLSDTKIRTAFSLLERAGYVKRVQVKDEKTGYFQGYDYHIGFEPFPEEERTDLVAIHKKDSRLKEIQTPENPDSGKSGIREIQILENREDIYRDNIQDRDNTENRDKRVVFHRPTLQEVRDYCAERKNSIDPEYFYDKMTGVGWTLKSGQKVKDWKAVIRTWEKYDNTPAKTNQQQVNTNQFQRLLK